MALQKKFVLPPPPNPDENFSDYSWRDWFRQLRDYVVSAGSILWSQIDFTGSKLSDILNRPHNVLQSIQGGATDQYYHLTNPEYIGTGSGTFVRQTNPTISSPNIDSIDFDTTASAPTRQTGRLFWDNADGNQTLSLYMAGTNAIQQVGEELYYRIKASSAITEGQVVMFTGTVGASGALTGAPASGLTSETASYIMGIATESIAHNAWGYVTAFGLVRGFNTSGGAESWVDGQILYYNPSVAGGLTKTVPTAPNAKIQVCAVINASSGGSGSVFVRPTYGGKLGQFEGDVGITSPTTGDLLQYDGSKWKNVTASSMLTAANVYSGTYTPSQGAANSNVSSVTYFKFQYMRVGNTVTMSGRIDVTATAVGYTLVNFTLPIASNLASTADCVGTATQVPSLVVNSSIGRIIGDSTNDTAILACNSTTTTVQNWWCTITYTIV